jgi:hypothetical protein
MTPSALGAGKPGSVTSNRSNLAWLTGQGLSNP